MKTASIEKILDVSPIEGADAIEVVSILGYKCVVRKGIFKAGNYAVYIPTDTCLPDKPQFEFMAKNKFRVKACRLRGQISQGLVFNISDFPELLTYINSNAFEEIDGLDIGEVLGIEKYEKPIPVQLSGKIRGFLPFGMPKTDEDNLRSNPRLLKELEGQECYISKKIDGSSATYYYSDDKFGACSRKLDIIEDENNSFWRIAKELDLDNKFKNYKDGPSKFALRGELYGEGIQKNKLGIKGIEFRAFDLWNIESHEYCGVEELIATCSDLEVEMVDVIWQGNFEFTLEELIEMANKQIYNNGKPCEGIVIRPIRNLHSKVLNGRMSAKVINENFLLKHGE